MKELEFLRNITKNMSEAAKLAYDYLRPILEAAINLENHTIKLASKFVEFSDTLSKWDYLLDNGWFPTPYILSSKIFELVKLTDVENLKNSDINRIFEDFFCNNQFEELELMINSWKNNKYFQKRIKLLEDSLVVLKTFRKNKTNLKINPSLILIPCLIAQFDDIVIEYAINNGYKMNGLNVTLDKKCVNKFDPILESPINTITIFETKAFEMLKEYLFSPGYPDEEGNIKQDLKKPKKVKLRPFFEFNRNRILHGTTVKYGSIDNLLRTFMIFDFLSNLN